VVRYADPDADAAACAAIYAPSVLDGVASFEEVAPDASEMAARIAKIGATHPWLVTERDGEVAGFAYGTQHRARRAYRWTAEVTVYVRPEHQRRGVGRELYSALLDLLRRQGFGLAVAGITLPNDPSVALHEALGFEPVGVYRRVGWKFGAWRDVGWWQLDLAPAADGQPPEPLPPPALPS
jgi:phosphinothricin acetyltransferase